MSDAAERGPNYDWKQEAEHYRQECDKLRDLLQKVEDSSERDLEAAQREIAELRQEPLFSQRLVPKLQAEIAELKTKLSLAEQDRDSWKNAHRITLDASNETIKKLLAKLEIARNALIKIDSIEDWAGGEDIELVNEMAKTARGALGKIGGEK